ncbi:MAG: family 78 glycoside hydrolase catalytic domain [Roseburia sp.]|nr:family 78 glycoside hydrolase catalytic domain [Roseburia sp.]
MESTAQFSETVRVLVSDDADMGHLVYDSGVMNPFRECCYQASVPLQPRTRYYWRVIVGTNAGEKCESTVSWFETAKRDEKWNAAWIAAAEETEYMPVLYRDFVVGEQLKQARLYIFGAGLYEVDINGEKAGDEYLLPGYHSYDMLLEYQTFSITEMLRSGENRISVLLGEGWYKGRFGFDDVYRNLYGDRKKCIAELWLEYESGRSEWIYTDKDWKAYTSNIGENNIYDGEWQDDTLEKTSLEVEVLSDDTLLLIERSDPPIRKVEEFAPVSVKMHEDGYLLLDFGETVTGWVEFSGKLEQGQKIRLQYGEVLQEEKFYRDNLRTARAEFVYVSDGKLKTVRPHFTYYGFRYVRVDGLKDGQELLFCAYRIMSDIKRSGRVETSDEKVNRLFENTLRSQKCNFLDIPTDCPQRDERMGWTGDANIFAHTACFHMDSPAFFRHYTKSLALEQKLLDGVIPFFSPRPKVPMKENTNPFYLGGGACIWGDVATMLPWTLYCYYGDKGLLQEQYPMMKAWVEYIRKRAEENAVPDLWQNDRHLGDWLALDTGDPESLAGRTDSNLLASACYYWSVSIVAEAAKVLGLEEKEEYRELAERIKKAFSAFYFTADGELKSEKTQTACAFLLYIGLYPENARDGLIKLLESLIIENNGHLNTGFAGTPVLCPVLSENGLNTLAYDLLLNEEYPGWLYEVNLGATTVWERWNSLEEDGRISGTGMNSLNHYAYGSIADWMYRYMCGFHPDMGREIKMRIKPVPDKRFSYVRGSWESVYGTYRSEWTYDETNGFQYEIEVPFNANADVIFPNGKSHRLDCGTYYFDQNGDIRAG